jgi:hypothetical protein
VKSQLQPYPKRLTKNAVITLRFIYACILASREDMPSICRLYSEEGYHLEVGIENSAGSHKGCARLLNALVLHASESKTLVPNMGCLETQLRVIGLVRNLMRELIPNVAQNMKVRPNGVCRQAKKPR